MNYDLSKTLSENKLNEQIDRYAGLNARIKQQADSYEKQKKEAAARAKKKAEETARLESEKTDRLIAGIKAQEELQKKYKEEEAVKKRLGQLSNKNFSNNAPFLQKGNLEKKKYISQLPKEKLFEIAKNWGWNMPTVYNDDKTVQLAMYYLIDIGWPKFGKAPNSKTQTPADVENSKKIIDFQVNQGQPIFLPSAGKYESSLNVRTKTPTKITNPRQTDGYNNCLGTISDARDDKTLNPKDVRFPKPNELEYYKNINEFCYYNFRLFVPPVELSVIDEITAKIEYAFSKEKLEAAVEKIREGMLSNTGAIVQLILSFFPVTRIAVGVGWALFLAYDAMKFGETKDGRYIVNMILDLLCLLTSGGGGKIASSMFKSAGTAAIKTFGEAVEYLAKTKVGQIFAGFAENVMVDVNFVGEMLKNLLVILKKIRPLRFLIKFVNKALEMVKKIAESIKNFLVRTGKKVSIAPKKAVRYITRKPVEMAAKYATNIAKKYITMFPDDKISETIIKNIGRIDVILIERAIKKQINAGVWKAATSYAETYLRDEPAIYVLSVFDKRYGTAFSDAYAAMLAYYKIHKDQVKGTVPTNFPGWFKSVSKGEVPYLKNCEDAAKFLESGKKLMYDLEKMKTIIVP